MRPATSPAPRPLDHEAEVVPVRPDGGLYGLKARTARHLTRIVDALVGRGVPADVITWAGFAVAAGAATAVVAGALVRPVWWLAVGPLVALRLLAAVADGEVARRAGTTRPAGALLGEVTDRAGDLLLAGGLAVVAPLAAALAAVGLLLADDVAALGWAITGRRAFPGIGGKPDRGATTAVGLALAVVWPPAAAATAWALCALVWLGAAFRLAALRKAVGR